ncbi:MAG: histidine phosphatase family protein [Aquimonas sp.]
MSLIAIRHGQASYAAADYDQLSDAGYEQSRRLGRWLMQHAPVPERVVIGAMRRHRQTWEALREAYVDAGIELPAPEVDADLNEFDHRAVLDGYAREHREASALFRVEPGAPVDPRRVLQQLLAALTAWTEDRIEGVPERWSQFQARTRAGAARLRPVAGTVLAVSSGGVLSQFAQTALDTSDARAIELNLSLRNSALCEFHHRTGALRLSSWNAVPHLAEARHLWTHF